MAKAPYFPLYVRDWLCSRRVLAMSSDSVKAFVYLLCESWLQTPRATLPNDDKELASMSRLSCERFAVVRDEIMQHFSVGTCEQHSGRLYNDTLLEVSRKYENKQRLGNKNAKRSQIKHKANARYENENESVLSALGSQRGLGGERGFTPPTVDEVRAYVHERGDLVDPEHFVDHYTANGWKVGRSSMKDWRAAVRTWEKRARSEKKAAEPVKKPWMGGW